MVIGIALVVFGLLISLVGLFIVGVPLVLFGGILVALSLMKKGASVTAAGAKAAYRSATTKTCPECKSRIPADAIVCLHCKYRYDSEAA